MQDAIQLDRPTWLVEGLVSSSLTLLSGKPKSGKSGLVQGLIAAILRNEPFLERPVLREVRRIIVVGTDPDAVIEYRDRLLDAGVTVEEAGDRLVIVKALRLNAELCRLVAEELRPAAGDVVVLDHLSDMEGDFNSQADVANVFGNIRAATGEAAVVVLAHSSTAVGQNGFSSKKPLGSTVIEGKARWIIHLEPRGASQRILTTRGNSGRGEVLRLETGDHAADFLVGSVETPEEAQIAGRRSRNKSTLEKRAEQCRWYEANCKGLSKAEASRRLSKEFGDTMNTWANRLTPSGWLGQMLARR
ncbi:AAA family ATPase [Arthrobacter sulfonylureivorans]|uniref:AAA family ATPase n=1 Tax=Arthrobacter sulfonylureivorans TaxID=2486855 RepID=A0ABY3WIT1_9MICC|nr:AAA family ATPase [Arthrobacter sulfonylureivorans]UNK47569.1 AAA family ATPase [Arthrobacter sulfonylureivorans]